jgi:serine/threonine-protein kinase
MADPNTVPAKPGGQPPAEGATADWVVAAASPSPSAAAHTLTQTEASTPGPAQAERRTDTDTERLREAAHTVLPEIPGFHVQKLIGFGGMGDVYQAVDLNLAKTVALKVMFPRGRDRGRIVGLFQREVQTLAQIEHPNVVPIYHAGEWRGFPYFTMKLVPGGSLAKQLGRFTSDPKACAQLMAKVARAVQALHDREVVHRDLKPLNILMDEGDEPLVADFGLAKFLDDAAPVQEDQYPLSFTGMPIGSPPYMSPEQTRGERTELPKATDIWAIGVTLYEMLAGKRPFQDAPGKDLFVRIREDDPPPLPETVSPELEAIVLKCLAKNPAERFRSASALAEYLETWLADKAAPQPLPLPKRTSGWLVGLRVLALLALIAVPAVLMPGAAPRKEQTIAERLRDGETIRLIGSKGMPLVEGRIVPGCEGALVRGQTGYATLSSAEFAGIELSSEELPWPVKLRAEYALIAPQGVISYAGVYVGRKSTPAVDPCESLIQVIHTESDTANGDKTAQLTETALCDLKAWSRKSAGFRKQFHVLRRTTTVPLELDQPLRWHVVELVIRPDILTGSWNGVELRSVLGARVSDWFWPRSIQSPLELWANGLASANPTGPPPRFTPPYIGPGIGVCVLNATAAFRNITIEPLAP